MKNENYISSNFSEFGWHDCRLYGIKLINERYILSFDIDYISKWHESDSGYSGFDVVPSVLTFFNVSRLRVDLDYGQNLLCFISEIKRTKSADASEAEAGVWDYEVECDVGAISFSATGFEQTSKSAPIRSDTQDLNRDRLVMD